MIHCATGSRMTGASMPDTSVTVTGGEVCPTITAGRGGMIMLSKITLAHSSINFLIQWDIRATRSRGLTGGALNRSASGPPTEKVM